MPDADRLRFALAELVLAAEEAGITLVLAGGYGVVLRVIEAASRSGPTLADVPLARSTTDLDVVLPIQVVIDVQAMHGLRRILDGFGYAPVAGAENYQFSRLEPGYGTIKVDFMAEEPPEDAAVTRDDRRVRPRGASGVLHAHRMEEALAILREREIGRGSPAWQWFWGR